MSQEGRRFIPQLDAVYEALADAIEGWSEGLGTDTEYFDPIHEEGGRHRWADALREGCDWAMRTALSLLTARGGASQADDLKRRMEALYDAAGGYEQRLGALEDQRRVHTEGIVAQYQEAFGDEDPDGARLGQLCRGINRMWTFTFDDRLPQTPEEFAEAVDRVRFQEYGAKGRAQAEMQRQATDLVEHFRLLAGIEAERAEPGAERKPEPAAADEDVDDEDADDEHLEVGLPEWDPHDPRAVKWIGKRLYLGHDTQVSRLFWLLVRRLGVPHDLAEVQREVDGMETPPDAPGDDFPKAMNRLAKALSKLRKQLREHKLDTHVFILKEGPNDNPTYTMFCRFSKY